ncbi:putative receptor-like protein kinase At3g47110 [Hevea brasiliensis]|uniref:putative receptor-like protein kinase At3g47110 n=1 Tax=Hevea brasiliensis TaxID=3981 RepID=UPI0025FF05CF|nr:putative receptor-like protein kinase At3g47110 [Hevea brasiliensis]
MRRLTVLFPFSVKCIVLLLIMRSSLEAPSIDSATTGSGNETDHLALLEFKAKIVHDPQNVMSSWNDSAHFCNWEGVTCGRKHKRVTKLNLQSQGLVGSLSPYIGNLSFLREIRLRNNTLSGKIPAEFGHLFRLQVLELFFNQLEGKIPSHLALCSKLRVLDMGFNKLENIPTELANLSMLIELRMQSNRLTGALPPFIGNLSSLEDFSVAINFLGGSIPDALGQLNRMLAIGLSENNFSGIIPPVIYNISSIRIFSMNGNSLHGSLPSDMGILLPHLQHLQLHDNYLSGSIPVSLSNASKLRQLSLARNNFNANVLVQFGLLKQLQWLILQGNSLGGQGDHGDLNFITSMANCSSLQYMDLSFNQFTGALPTTVANLSSTLRLFAVASNRIYGNLPLGLFDLVNLPRIILEKNQITGTIPAEIGRLQKLEELFLDRNRLFGEIPSSIGNLSSLISLRLDDNKLQGNIPSSFGNCHNLLFLRLSRNNLSGSIPKQFFILSASLYCWFKKQKRNQSPGSVEMKSFRKLSYQRILKATDGFSTANFLGAGRFGSVYKGTLEEDGAIVAVKVLNLQQRGAEKSFMAECKVLQNVRHRNLVRIMTSCSSIDFQGNDFKALVYEYMPNGNLSKWLHPRSEIYAEPAEQWSLSLLQRMNIAIDVASALDYLHHGCQKPIIHCDLKPGNVLLDDDMVAHIGDFGLAKFLSQLTIPIQSSSVGVRGTVGYAAPEYGLGSEPSTSGDVYSYGILLLEMVTAKKPTDDIFVEGLSLHNFARMALPVQILEIVDPILLQEEEEEARLNSNQGPTQARNESKFECLSSMINVGVACSMDSPQERMDISNAVKELHSIRNNYMRARTGPSTHRSK